MKLICPECGSPKCRGNCGGTTIELVGVVCHVCGNPNCPTPGGCNG